MLIRFFLKRMDGIALEVKHPFRHKKRVSNLEKATLGAAFRNK